jgi:phosphatidate cytidylyltransferase
MKETTRRTLTAFVLIPVVAALIEFLPLLAFSAVIFLIISRVAYEFVLLCRPQRFSFPIMYFSGLLIALAFTIGIPDLPMAIVVIVFVIGLFYLFSIRNKEYLETFVKDIGVHFLVVFYIYLPLYYLLELKKLGVNYLFFLIGVIIVGDSGAYFIGRWIGKHYIYPVASPKKTLEGLLAAIITASLTGWIALLVFPLPVKTWMAVLSAGIIGLVSQLSDPVESLFKRSASQKDSSSLLPGHGGLFDRLDSYIFCSPLMYYLVISLWNL